MIAKNYSVFSDSHLSDEEIQDIVSKRYLRWILIQTEVDLSSVDVEKLAELTACFFLGAAHEPAPDKM